MSKQFNNLKTSIAAVIKNNGANEIDGYALQQKLLSMVDSMELCNFEGFADTETVPVTDATCDHYYVAIAQGVYENFDSFVVTSGDVVIFSKGIGESTWTKTNVASGLKSMISALDNAKQAKLTAGGGIGINGTTIGVSVDAEKMEIVSGKVSVKDTYVEGKAGSVVTSRKGVDIASLESGHLPQSQLPAGMGYLTEEEEAALVANVNTAISGANSAASAATSAASNATTAASTATTAASTADAATGRANAATSSANSAAQTASTAAQSAQTAISSVTGVVAECRAEIQSSQTATANATTAASNANTATASANAATAQLQAKLNTADADHTRANTDHSTATADHTQAGTDHTNAVNQLAQQATTFQQSEASRAATFASKEAERDAAIASVTDFEDKVTALDRNKADKNGHYEGMSVAMAENLIGKGTASEQTFAERVAGGTLSIEDGVAEYRVTKGNSVVANQLFNISTQTINGVTITNNGDGSYTLNGTATAGIDLYNQFPTKRYFVFARGVDDDVYAYATGIGSIKENTNIDMTIGGTVDLCIYAGVELTNKKVTLVVIDLTKWYNGNVPSGLTAEKFLELNPQVLTMGYNEGEIVNFSAKKVVTTGRNLWDEEWMKGKALGSGGSIMTYSGFCVIACKLLPRQTYYIKSPYTPSYTALMVNGVRDASFSIYNNTTFTINHDGDIELRLQFTGEWDYNHDICINISDASFNGQYEPYEQHELDVDPTTILDSEGQQLFPNGLCKAGTVYDEITKDGAIKRIGKRAYQSGDESNTSYVTDGTNTLYPLATPISVTFSDERQTDIEVFTNGMERIVVAEGGKSTPIVADVNYGIDYVGTIDRLHDDVGKASDLTTTARNTLVAAINELVARVAALETSTTSEGGE